MIRSKKLNRIAILLAVICLFNNKKTPEVIETPEVRVEYTTSNIEEKKNEIVKHTNSITVNDVISIVNSKTNFTMNINEKDAEKLLEVIEEYYNDDKENMLALLLTTMEIETNFKNISSSNKNGTKDYGIMQLNDVTIKGCDENLDPIHSTKDNIIVGAGHIVECYNKAKEKYPTDAIWWTYSYYNRGLYFENTEAWKHGGYKLANKKSSEFRNNFNSYLQLIKTLNIS